MLCTTSGQHPTFFELPGPPPQPLPNSSCDVLNEQWLLGCGPSGDHTDLHHLTVLMAPAHDGD